MPETTNPPAATGGCSLEPLVSCRVCGTETKAKDLTHLKIYVTGSEGVDVCLICRMTLTEVLRGMMAANLRGRKQGYLAAKEVAAAKAANR